MGDTPTQPVTTELDVVVVGAGFAGMYLLYRLRTMGFVTKVYDAASDVGGTWFWNRYPGARCDVPSLDYSYSFDPDLEQEWEWTERFAAQPEILTYARHVAERHDLRRDIEFETRIESATFDEVARRWEVRTSRGVRLLAQHVVLAVGTLSTPKPPEIDGFGTFAGPTYWTARWPHDDVDFTGRRVGVIGTGSSGIQSIPVIAAQAAHTTVFQRTANFSMPARNRPLTGNEVAARKARAREYRAAARTSYSGFLVDIDAPPATLPSILAVPEAERVAMLEQKWTEGGLGLTSGFSDVASDVTANAVAAEFVREKIRSIVSDPQVAEDLCPTSHPIGTKRPCLDTGYYETYNRPNVRLVNLRRNPIRSIDAAGVELDDEHVALDALVVATGFDAMTGSLVSIDLRGRDGVSLAEAWAEGPRTYLGLAVAGFPNLHLVTGPQSPSVLSNMMVSIEQHVEWITDAIAHLRAHRMQMIETTPDAVEGWVEHSTELGSRTLFPLADSWYMGANVPGKPRVFLPYVGGCGHYRKRCDRVVAKNYEGFVLS